NNESGYKVYRRSGNGGWELIATLGANATEYKDGTVAAGTSYTYRVLAYNGVGNSAWSNERTATTPADQPAPVEPTAPAAPSPGPGQMAPQLRPRRVGRHRWNRPHRQRPAACRWRRGTAAALA